VIARESGAVVLGGPASLAPLLEIDDLHVSFVTPEGTVRAVNGVSLTVLPGEMLAILGESGSGKSVTMQAVMGMVPSPPGRVESRTIRFAGNDIAAAGTAAMRKIRGREIGMVFQDAVTSLDPGRTVGYQLSEVFRVHRGMSRRKARQRAIELMDRVRIPSAAQRVDDYPHQFSGGMCQRIMIAIAIALEPRLLIADEPTTALDVTVQAQIMDLIQELRSDLGMAVVLIAHDIELAAEHADRVAVMYAGSVFETGPMLDVYRSPSNPYTQGLLKSMLSADTDETGDGELRPIPGAPPVLSKLPAGCAFAPRCEFVHEPCALSRPPLGELAPGRASACHLTSGASDG
jgi:oligopeptide transport system ATP-binding protein